MHQLQKQTNYTFSLGFYNISLIIIYLNFQLKPYIYIYFEPYISHIHACLLMMAAIQPYMNQTELQADVAG